MEKPVYVPDFGMSEGRHNCRPRSGGHKVPETISRDLSSSIGSGVIVDPVGDVVSSDRLVADARKLTVQLYDGSQHTARLVGSDRLTDLALLKIDANGPTPHLEWGDSDEALVGDWVLAAGSPFGLTNSVRLGILSARGRYLNIGPYDDFLQIDAAINLGDSGGPEVNLKGEVIGINAAIYSAGAGSIGIAFATPSNLAKPLIDEIKSRGRVERGWLGVQAQAVTPEVAESFGLRRAEGLIVDHVSDAGPAAVAGLDRGDIILSIDDHPFSKPSELPLMISQIPIGTEVRLRVWRARKEIWIDVVVARMPQVEGAQALNHREAQQQTCE
ncbi:MAG TPA: trypsin-like peptidase domain-containing protein [Stellaceae bacterium]|nr:trypsin-like peptidase domain-containing protein [Stellaceae bacterium]